MASSRTRAGGGTPVPASLRVTAVNDAAVAPDGDHVLYWMIAARRTTWSFALDHAIARAIELGRPLIVFEPLRAGYAWASDRMHAFVLQGMADNARAFAAAKITYLPYVEPVAGKGAGLLAALARRACLVVTDEQPGFAQLERAETADPVWNAAQRQLVAEGRIHNYLRMLWGKNILAWSRTPQVALATLTELNNKYAVDGRDPNSYSGIFWTLGRFDRPWGPIRPIFGAVRYMTSSSTLRKLHLRGYLARWSGDPPTARRA